MTTSIPESKVPSLSISSRKYHCHLLLVTFIFPFILPYINRMLQQGLNSQDTTADVLAMDIPSWVLSVIKDTRFL